MTERRHPGYEIGHATAEAEGRNETVTFGFWVFLMSDVVLFSMLFATYAVLIVGTGAGPAPGDVITLTYAFPETLALLLSTLTLGFMSVALRDADGRAVVLWLGATLALGCIFLALEATEFSGMIARGDVPQVSGFLSALFTLVGAHGLHVSAGVAWGLVMLAQIAVFGLAGPVRSRLVRLALYWHMLDIVWVAIFSVVYLPGAL